MEGRGIRATRSSVERRGAHPGWTLYRFNRRKNRNLAPGHEENTLLPPGPLFVYRECACLRVWITSTFLDPEILKVLRILCLVVSTPANKATVLERTSVHNIHTLQVCHIFAYNGVVDLWSMLAHIPSPSMECLGLWNRRSLKRFRKTRVSTLHTRHPGRVQPRCPVATGQPMTNAIGR